MQISLWSIDVTLRVPRAGPPRSCQWAASGKDLPTLKAAPFFLILFILLGGALMAYQTVTAPVETSGTPADRPTVTPRPRPAAPNGSQATATPIPSFSLGPTSTPAPQPGVAVAPAATPAPAATAAPTPTAILKVGNTDGQGVYLRKTPQMSDKIRPWLDGTAMTILGPQVTGDGHNWQHVRAPDGVEGYVPAEYLVP